MPGLHLQPPASVRHLLSRLGSTGVLLLALAPPCSPPASAAPATPPAPGPRVYRDRIEPHWFSRTNRFWYRNDLPAEGREFIVVDALQGTRQPAFDHARVAEALTRLLGRTIEPARLPVEELRFPEDGGPIVLSGPDGAWKFDPAQGTLAPETDGGAAGRGLPVEAEPRPSARTGPETAITFENRLPTDVELAWMDTEGERRSYGILKAGESRRQHTFAGHVWIALREGQPVAVFEAAPQPARALIDGRPPDPQPGRRGARSAARGNRRNAEAAPAPTSVRSPDGRREAFVRDHNLWLRDVRSGSETALSFDGNPGHSFTRDVQRARLMGMEYDAPEPPPTLPEVFWSPDSRRLVALQTRRVPERRVHLVQSSPRDQLQPKTDSYPYLKPGDEIPVQTPRLFEAEPAAEVPFARDAFAQPWSLEQIRWAPDSSRFTCLHNERGHQVLRVIAVKPPSPPGPDPAHPTPATVTVLVEERSPTFIDYSNKTTLEFLDDAGELLWMSERDGWNHLYLVDHRTGSVKAQVTRGAWVVRGVEHLDVPRRQLWIRLSGYHPDQDPYHVHLARVNLDGSGLMPATEGDGTHAFQWSPDRRFFIDTWSRVDHPPVHELRRAEDGRRVLELERADASEVLAARGRFPERFVAPGRDGTTPIWGLIHRPRDFDPARRYPVIENIYAGPHDQHVPKAFRAAYRHQQEIADRGFIVVQIDGMGTNWRSRKFHDVAARNIGDAGFPDRIAWLRAAAARFPELDLARVGIYGGSAGGQNALRAVLAHGDFYRAAVADCGCHDNRMDKIWWNEAWMGWPVGPHYAEQSNVTQAHRLQGRLMLVVGELDKNVDPASTTQVVDALVRANKDFDFVLIPGAGHGAAESDYGRRRRADFFVRHLATP